ncbi:MAG TPA: ATP-binding protein [Mesorhizobium sp.]|uniref:sensor histidine kinase n=1 Tax=Mesorhizobium sp. TaxID=1871066 RepID=UPI002DDD3729|nr:ATP-binding protein [Mesorhizobium sp.]HEV2505125.1 ATP-binding protein [Mesorhizobium sp.]
MLNGLTLRWRLVLAFLAVSVPPVLIASYVAAVLISSSFKHNVERWLGRAADFLVSETMSSEDEADRAASILGASLPTHGGALTGEVNENSTSLRVYSDLLSTVGYDLVLIYDDKGNTLYRFGNATLDMPLPRTSTRSVFTVTKEDRPGLVVGAARMFERDGQVLHVLVANQIDDSFFAAPRAKTAIIIHAYRLQGNSMIPLVREGRGDPLTISDDVLAILNRGDSYTVVPDKGSGGLATGYGAIRDDSGRLVGIVTFGLAARRPVFEQLIDWRLFTILALIASSLSITVGIVLASRLTGPLQSLKRGLREVASGNYRLQLPERGGPEIAEVASGFNIMTRQLERLRQMEGEMRRREQLAALGEAAAVIAHEIRNPLGIIKTSSQLVAQRSYLAQPDERLLGFILDEVNRIDRLVTEVLDYVRPNRPTMRVVALDEIVSKAIDFMAPELDKRGITRDVAVTNGLMVEADADQIHQVVINLVLNAMEAMADGGKLTVKAEADEEAAEAVLTIADCGAGMEPDVVHRMFDPFFTTKTKGTGLGLAKVLSVVEHHGGAITCTSALESGTSIVIRLPLNQKKGPNGELDPGR